jgi:hypothetical protein
MNALFGGEPMCGCEGTTNGVEEVAADQDVMLRELKTGKSLGERQASDSRGSGHSDDGSAAAPRHPAQVRALRNAF